MPWFSHLHAFLKLSKLFHWSWFISSQSVLQKSVLFCHTILSHPIRKQDNFLCTYMCTVSADCREMVERNCWSFVSLNMTWKIQCQCNLTSNLHLNEFAIVRLYSRQKLQCIVMLIMTQWVFLEDYTYLSNKLLLQECKFDPL